MDNIKLLLLCYYYNMKGEGDPNGKCELSVCGVTTGKFMGEYG